MGKLDSKPPCMCGHSYAAHTWGTSFCSNYSDVAAINTENPTLCGCKKYREGLCSCGHAWEVHGIGNEFLNCPVCGRECKHWNETGKMENRVADKLVERDRKLAEIAKYCKCGHTDFWHVSYTKECDYEECNCSKFSDKNSDYKLKCDKCVYVQLSDFEIQHGEDCPLWPGSIEASSTNNAKETRIRLNCICGHSDTDHPCIECEAPRCDCKQFHSERDTKNKEENSTLKQWQKELEEEERLKPVCTCGHEWNSHYDENGKLPCAECWTDGGEAWDTSCHNYIPAKTSEFSEDPATVNAAALKQIGDTGKMSPEEISRKIEEWKAKFNKQDSDTSGTVQKQPIGQSFGGVYSGQGTGYNQDFHWSKCNHKPQKVIDGKTWEVWAGTKSDCLPSIYSFDVILNVSNGLDMIPNHRIPFKWAQKYEVCHTKEIILDWPDGSIPVIPHVFWKDLRAHLASTKSKMLVCCIGGHGRTGTSIAAILISSGWTAAQAKNWIWRHYCKEAIETQIQEQYLDMLETAFKPKVKERKAKVVKNGETK